MTTIEQAVLHHALICHEKTAVIDHAGIYSYAYMSDMILKISHLLTKEMALAAGERVIAECTQAVCSGKRGYVA